MPEPALVYIARHGETRSNVIGRYAGRSDEPLTNLGREQIEKLALRLLGHDITEIWSSEIGRARESAHILAEKLRAGVTLDPRLNEIAMGPWEGLTEGEVANRYPKAYALWLERPDLVRVPGRETLTMVAQRIHAALSEAARRPRPVLLVTHVAPIRILALNILGISLRRYRDVRVDNGGCFVVDRGCREIRRFGQIDLLLADVCSCGIGTATRVRGAR